MPVPQPPVIAAGDDRVRNTCPGPVGQDDSGAGLQRAIKDEVGGRER